MIRWLCYPKSDKPPLIVNTIVAAFQSIADQIDSESQTLVSNDVLAAIAPQLIEAGFKNETGKKTAEKIHVPVLFGMNGKIDKSFEADANHESDGVVLEVEAGRGVTNNQFLKDLFQASMMHDVFYLGIAIRNNYRGNKNFDTVVFFRCNVRKQSAAAPAQGIVGDRILKPKCYIT